MKLVTIPSRARHILGDETSDEIASEINSALETVMVKIPQETRNLLLNEVLEDRITQQREFNRFSTHVDEKVGELSEKIDARFNKLEKQVSDATLDQQKQMDALKLDLHKQVSEIRKDFSNQTTAVVITIILAVVVATLLPIGIALAQKLIGKF